ncbi:hypothetical protein M5C90_25690 [Pseudomonas chlororaphis subsp. piscium]|nr:hypothetical protein M5C90_25690 [Pseudomonas chlororaphis subsp. piscium]
MANNISSIDGGLDIYTSGSRIGISNRTEPSDDPQAFIHLVNNGDATCGLRTTSYWTGSLSSPYQNNDNSLWEVFNNVTSDSLNRSWAGSFANAYNNIPADTIDNGERTGIIGWATSVASPDYVHEGTLDQQLGVYGVAGFQGAGSATTAVIRYATGVRGYIYNDSVGATIEHATAGEFISTSSVGNTAENIAVFASAANGTTSNYSFYGNAGKLFNAEQAIFGTQMTQSLSRVAARSVANAFEFGYPDTGFGCNIGASYSSGQPFLAFCAEADQSGNTFTTRGNPGVVISSDLSGALIFSRLTEASSAGQSLNESMRLNADGRPVIPSKTPASANAPGQQWEFAYDANYFYVCVATDTWKRIALSSW